MPALPRALFPAASAVVSRLSGYLILIAAARLLHPESFGVFAVLAAVAAVANAFVSGGGDMWLNRLTWGARGPKGRAPYLWHFYITTVAMLAVAVFALSIVVAYSVRPLYPFRAEIVWALSWAAIAGIAEALLAVARAGGMTRMFFGVRDLAVPLSILGIVVVVRPDTPGGIFTIFAAVWLAALIVIGVALAARGRDLLPPVRWRKSVWRKLVAHTAGLIYGNLGSRLSVYIDVLVLTWLISLADLGEYRIAAQIAVGFIVVQHFVFLGLPWQLRQIGTPRDPGAGHAAVIWRQRTLLSMSLLALVVLLLAATPLLALFGQRFTDVAPVFRILLVVRFCELLWGPQHEVLVSNGHILEDARSNVIALAAWVATFAIAYLYATPVAAVVTGNVAASLTAHAMRYEMIERVGLRHGAGHGFGPLLPVLLSLAMGVIAMLAL
ncbi:MAG: oligosaccharide flippase family protein [Alphaproteobacteria bacterium]